MHVSVPVRRVLALVLLVVLTSCGSSSPKVSAVIDQVTPAADFTLTTSNGTPWRMADQQGKLVLMFFGFTNCPDVCPTTLADMAATRTQLGADADKVEMVLVSIDPERDTPEKLTKYAAAFDPAIVALRGDQAQLDPVLKAYGVVAQRRDLPDSALEYTMDHSSAIYVIDRAGNWRGLIPFGAPLEDVVHDVKYFLNSTGA